VVVLSDLKATSCCPRLVIQFSIFYWRASRMAILLASL
jgi:hypothetical protein